MEQLGINLRRLRVLRDISQADVAQATDVGQSMISAIENGEKRPSLELAMKIAVFFGVSLDTLLGMDASGVLSATVEPGHD